MSGGEQWLRHEALLDELDETQHNINHWQARQQRVLHALANDPPAAPEPHRGQREETGP